MRFKYNPISFTIAYGFIVSLVFLTFILLNKHLIIQYISVSFVFFFNLTLVFYLLGLSNIFKIRIISFLYPILLLLFCSYFSQGMGGLALGIAIMAWIRSGIFFKVENTHVLFLELLISLASVITFLVIQPKTALEWTGMVWFFYLIQSFYLITSQSKIKRDLNRSCQNEVSMRFQRTIDKAERLLSNIKETRRG